MSNPRVNQRFINHHVVAGLVIRIGLAWLLPWLLDDEKFIPGVAYTDIDYHVFTDAAAHIQRGGSPYDRHTYRYTPFLAAILALFPSKEVGRYIFCIADTLVGWLVVYFRQQERIKQRSGEVEKVDAHFLSPELVDAVWWLYNPLAINICTRGSGESLVVLLPVLLTVWICRNKHSRYNDLTLAACAGLCHGISVHAKLYPIIYTLSFMTNFARLEPKRLNPSLFSLLAAWIRRLLQPAPIVFALSFIATFSALTFLAVHFFGPAALHEGLLYHFSRVDHRHNYSMHWYWIYLAMVSGESMALVGRLLLLPQALLLLVSSLGLAPGNLGLALFVQTFLFVAQNKVITAQYFTWYLCLLPLCSFRLTSGVCRAVLGVFLAVVVWLGNAYRLEMLGAACHRTVWLASVLFFAANVYLLKELLRSLPIKKFKQM